MTSLDRPNAAVRGTSLLVAFVVATACGDDGGTPSPLGAGTSEAQCEMLDPFVCEESHGDRCSATQRAAIDQELGCRSDTFVDIYCSPTAECANAEQIARSAEGLISLVRGCLEGTAYSPVETPSDQLLSAASVSCREGYFVGDEICRQFSPQSCPTSDTHCRIAEGHRFRPENGCVDYGDATRPECRAPRSGAENTLVEDPEGRLWVFSTRNHWPVAWEDVHLNPSVNYPGFARIGENNACTD